MGAAFGSLAACSGDEVSVTKIEVSGAPSGRYAVGAEYDASAISVTVTYSDGTTKVYTYDESTTDITCAGWQSESEGTYTFEVTCAGKTEKFSYYIGDVAVTLDLNGGTLTVGGNKYDDTYAIGVGGYSVDLTGYTPVKLDGDGYAMSFAGWYTDEECTTRAELTAGILRANDNVTLYAGYDTDWSWLFDYTVAYNETSGETEVRLDKLKDMVSYTDEDGTVSKVEDKRYTAMDTVLTIPNTVEGYPVTSIGSYFSTYDIEVSAYAVYHKFEKITFEEDSPMREICEYAFSSDKVVTEIDFPENLEVIGKYAFANNTTLDMQSVCFPASLTKIMDYAFESVFIDEVSFAEGSELKSIGYGAFMGAAISKITLPNGLEEIGGYAFAGCPYITYLHIPESVSKIGSYAFNSMNALEDIEVDDMNAAYFSDENGNLYQYGDSNDVYLVRYAPDDEDVTEYTLPSNTTRILEAAFSVKDVTVSGGNNGYSYLEKINLPEGLVYIGDKAFSGISADFAIPSTVETIFPQSFYGWKGSEFKVSEDNKYFQTIDGVLYDKSVNASGEETAESGTKLLSVPMYLDVSEAEGVFTVPEKVKTISSYAFALNSSIEYIVIPSDSALESVYSGGLAIYSMSAIKGLYILKETPFEVQHNAFKDTSYINQTVSIFASAKSAYVTAWATYTEDSSYTNQKALSDRLHSFAPAEIADYLGELGFISYEKFVAAGNSTAANSLTNYYYYATGMDSLIAFYNSSSAVEALAAATDTQYAEYFKAFAECAYSAVYDGYSFYLEYGYIEYLADYAVSIITTFISAYEEVLPDDIKTAVETFYQSLKNCEEDIEELTENRAACVKEIMGFDLSDGLTEEKYSALAALMDKYDSCGAAYSSSFSYSYDKVTELSVAAAIYRVLNDIGEEYDISYDIYNVNMQRSYSRLYRMRQILGYPAYAQKLAKECMQSAIDTYKNADSALTDEVSQSLQSYIYDSTGAEYYLGELTDAEQESISCYSEYVQAKTALDVARAAYFNKVLSFEISDMELEDAQSDYSYEKLYALVNDEWDTYYMEVYVDDYYGGFDTAAFENYGLSKYDFDIDELEYKFRLLETTCCLYQFSKLEGITEDNITSAMKLAAVIKYNVENELEDEDVESLYKYSECAAQFDALCCDYLIYKLKSRYSDDLCSDAATILIYGELNDEGNLIGGSFTAKGNLEYIRLRISAINVYVESGGTTALNSELLEYYNTAKASADTARSEYFAKVKAFNDNFSEANLANEDSGYSFSDLYTLLYTDGQNYGLTVMFALGDENKSETLKENEAAFNILCCNYALYRIFSTEDIAADYSTVDSMMTCALIIENYSVGLTDAQRSALYHYKDYLSIKDKIYCDYLIGDLLVYYDYDAAFEYAFYYDYAEKIIEDGGYNGCVFYGVFSESLSVDFKSINYYLTEVFTTDEKRRELYAYDEYVKAKAAFDAATAALSE